MRKPAALSLALCGALLLGACSSGGNRPARSPTSLATAPPPQTPTAGTPRAAVFMTPAPPATDVATIVQQVKIPITELPQGFGYGQFQAYQSNDQALNGYDEEPKALLDRMNRTGRLGGYIQQLVTGDTPGGIGLSIDVWRDAAGAKAFFADYPRPSKDVKWDETTLPQPLGEQVFAYHYTLEGPSGTSAGYSITWLNGRLILGVGQNFPQGKESLDKLMTIATLLDHRATAAQQ